LSDWLTADALNKVYDRVALPQRVLCLGLGSVVDGTANGMRVSRTQLVFLLELKKLLVNVSLSRSC
jgi:SRR1